MQTRSSTPLISVVISTKNEMPHLKKAIEGLRRQTFKNFELLVQDRGSTDGTLEYLADFPSIEVQSAPDTSIGQAYNQGIARCKGDFIFLASANDCLFPHALQTLLSWAHEHPSAPIVCGGVAPMGHMTSPFNLAKFIQCESAQLTAALFNKKIIGQDLNYDEMLQTCHNYDLWIRIGRRFPSEQIVCRPEVLMSSSAAPAESFEQFCQDKCLILDRFLDAEKNKPNSILQVPDLTRFGLQAKANIFTWAAKEVMHLEGVSPRSQKLCEEAENWSRQIDRPPQAVHLSFMNFRLHHKLSKWLPRVHSTKLPKRLKGNSLKWGSFATARLSQVYDAEPYWVKIRMKVLSGAVGICFMHQQGVQKEKIFPAGSKEVTTYYPFHHPEDFSIVFRNGGIQKSNVEIYELAVIQAVPSRDGEHF